MSELKRISIPTGMITAKSDLRWAVEVLDSEGTAWERWRKISGMLDSPERAEEFLQSSLDYSERHRTFRHRIVEVINKEVVVAEWNPEESDGDTGVTDG